MSGVTSASDQSALGTAQDVGAAFATVAKELGIAVFVAMWTVVWIALTVQTVQSESLLDGAVVALYTLGPVLGVLLWRLGERTSFAPPTVDDLVGPDGSTGGADEPADDVDEPADEEVADRYAFGED